MFCIMYNAHPDNLVMDHQVIGPFSSFEDAYDYMCTLPAPAPGGHKYINEMVKPC
jgi:hypothetical protein